MKSLFWKEPGQLDFRFNLKAFNLDYDAIGKPLSENDLFDKPTLFIRGGNSSYIKDKDFEGIIKNEDHHQCGIGKISIFNNDNNVLSNSIGQEILAWFDTIPSEC